MKLEHGTFHCYYKPSFANYNHEHRLLTQSISFAENGEPEYNDARKYPNVTDQLLNQKYMDKFELDQTFVESKDF